MLLTDGTVPLRPLMQGGTGSLSASLSMPDFLPDALEAGTVNVPGIASLDAGIQWIVQQGAERILRHEHALCTQLIAGLEQMDGAAVYRSKGAAYAPVVSFTLSEEAPDETAARLSAAGFCLRAGLHCAPLAHETLGTVRGTVRFSPSVMNTPQEVSALLKCLRQI